MLCKCKFNLICQMIKAQGKRNPTGFECSTCSINEMPLGKGTSSTQESFASKYIPNLQKS